MVGVGLLMVIAQVTLRAWALYPSWFYLDDYNLLLDAQGRTLDADYLLTPYNSHLMPAGRLIAWLVADAGTLNWTLAATCLLVLQSLAGLGALWMLVTLFRARWAVLAPLALYLSSVLTLPAMMWWTAGLNQVFLQAAFFLTVGAWVRYLRARRLPWLAATGLGLTLGLLFYVKALLILPVLAYLALAYFADGSPLRRLGTVIGRYWPAAVVGAVISGAYLSYYLANVRQPLTGTTLTVLGGIADSMLGTAFMTAVVGGPWRWAALAPPNAFADSPPWAVHAAWVGVAMVVAYAALRRTGTLRAWVLLLIYLAGLLNLLVNSRAPVYGPVIGLEYRYLTDAACAVALCLGLVFLELGGAPGSSRPRVDPLLRVRLPRRAVVGLVLAVCLSGLASSVRYVEIWHTQNASDAYLHTLARSLRTHGAVELADTAVPEEVVPGSFSPENRVSRLVPLLSDTASFPDTSGRLATVGPDGTLRRTLIEPGVTAEPGPSPDCGWLVRATGRTIPLTSRAFPWEWWVRIGYLSGRDSDLTVVAGTDRVAVSVESGLHDVYLKVDGSFDEIRFEGLDPGATMCVDTIEVGQPVPGGALP